MSFSSRLTNIGTSGTTNKILFEQGIKNLLYNGDGFVHQRGAQIFDGTTPSTVDSMADGAYVLDGWIFLGTTSDSAQYDYETTFISAGSRSAISLKVKTEDEKFGMFQVLEAADSAPYISSGVPLSLSCDIRVSGSSTIEGVGMAILAWTNTADSITRDWVTNWQSQGTAPTPISNWTVVSSTIVAPSSTGFTRIKLENISVDTANAANIGVFIWMDSTSNAANEFMYFTNVMLNEGPRAAPYEKINVADQVARCQRYYVKTYNLTVQPGTTTAVGQISHPSTAHADFGGSEAIMQWHFPVSLRETLATLAYYDPTDGTVSKANNGGAAISLSVSANTERADMVCVADPAKGVLEVQMTASKEL